MGDGEALPRIHHHQRWRAVYCRHARAPFACAHVLFARAPRQNWLMWGNETEKFPEYDAAKNAKDGYDLAISELRKRHEAKP